MQGYWPTSTSLPCRLILLTSTVVQPIVSSWFKHFTNCNIFESHLSNLVFVEDLHLNLVLGASVDVQVVLPDRLEGLLAHLHIVIITKLQEEIPKSKPLFHSAGSHK